jgi:hypothetical protein
MGSHGLLSSGPRTVDEMIRKLAREEVENGPPLISFPKQAKDHGGGYDQFNDQFNGKDLDRLVEGAAQRYLARGLPLGVCTGLVARHPFYPENTLWLTIEWTDTKRGPGRRNDWEVHL